MKTEDKNIILIIEDDEILLRALYMIFHSGDYTIATASDGDTGLKMATRMTPDIILLDLLLPKMNGFDFLKFIKANPVLKDIPVIVLSNLGDQDDIDKVKELGASDFFIKSNTDLSVLKEKIDKILNKAKSKK